MVGGNAVAAWVSRADEAAVRNTRAVDILLARADLPTATIALEAAGFHHRRVASLGHGGTLDVFLDGAASKVGDAVHIVFAEEKTRPDQPEPNARIDESEDAGEFRLISLAALVRMKLAASATKTATTCATWSPSASSMNPGSPASPPPFANVSPSSYPRRRDALMPLPPTAPPMGYQEFGRTATSAIL